jgi:hypothetical protein
MKILGVEKLFGAKGSFGEWKTGDNHFSPKENGDRWESDCDLGACGMKAVKATDEYANILFSKF